MAVCVQRNIGFQRKLLERNQQFPNIWKIQAFFAVSKQNPIVYSTARERAKNRSYVGDSYSYVGDNKSYVGDSNSYVVDDNSYVTYLHLRRTY